MQYIVILAYITDPLLSLLQESLTLMYPLLGSYSLGDAASCVTCPAGKNCSDQTTEPPTCDAGYYSSEGDAYCSQCPTGIQDYAHSFIPLHIQLVPIVLLSLSRLLANLESSSAIIHTLGLT